MIQASHNHQANRLVTRLVTRLAPRLVQRVRSLSRQLACLTLLMLGVWQNVYAGSANAAPASFNTALAAPLTTVNKAGVPNNLQRWKDAVLDYLRINTRSLPGEVSFAVNVQDDAVLPECANPEVVPTQGGRLWGKTQIGVLCPGVTGSIRYISAQIKVVGDYYTTTHPLAAGMQLTAADITAVRGDLTQQPLSAVTNMQQAVGSVLSVGLMQGQTLRNENLRRPITVRSGQQVRVFTHGPGFTVTQDGRAVGQATEGQVVQVRLGNGQSISGIARVDGTVEVAY